MTVCDFDIDVPAPDLSPNRPERLYVSAETGSIDSSGEVELVGNFPNMPARVGAGKNRLAESILRNLIRGISPGLDINLSYRRFTHNQIEKTLYSFHHVTLMTTTCVNFL